jgi:hypothetical protein
MLRVLRSFMLHFGCIKAEALGCWFTSLSSINNPLIGSGSDNFVVSTLHSNAALQPGSCRGACAKSTSPHQNPGCGRSRQAAVELGSPYLITSSCQRSCTDRLSCSTFDVNGRPRQADCGWTGVVQTRYCKVYQIESLPVPGTGEAWPGTY